jgi:hypothetical protein
MSAAARRATARRAAVEAERDAHAADGGDRLRAAGDGPWPPARGRSALGARGIVSGSRHGRR